MIMTLNINHLNTQLNAKKKIRMDKKQDLTICYLQDTL